MFDADGEPTPTINQPSSSILESTCNIVYRLLLRPLAAYDLQSVLLALGRFGVVLTRCQRFSVTEKNTLESGRTHLPTAKHTCTQPPTRERQAVQNASHDSYTFCPKNLLVLFWHMSHTANETTRCSKGVSDSCIRLLYTHSRHELT
jgi:hypothetical protein